MGAGTRGPVRLVVGTINLYQVGEWAVSHVWRHDAQVERAIAAAAEREPAGDGTPPSG